MLGGWETTFEPGAVEKFCRRRSDAAAAAQREKRISRDVRVRGARAARGGGEACCRPSDLGDSEDPSTNLSDATRNAINKR